MRKAQFFFYLFILHIISFGFDPQHIVRIICREIFIKIAIKYYFHHRKSAQYFFFVKRRNFHIQLELYYLHQDIIYVQWISTIGFSFFFASFNNFFKFSIK